MTPGEIRRRIEAICIDDSEGAHWEEDRLRSDVLNAIAKGECKNPAACAAAALETKLLDFARWYA